MKDRLDPFSDAVFAIIMTLLVFFIDVPMITLERLTQEELTHQLLALAPNFAVFFYSFLVLGTYWISHNIIIGVFAKNFDRPLAMLNFLFLALTGLIPFSAGVLANHPTSRTAILLYSCNILALTLSLSALRLYILYSPSIQNPVDHDLNYKPIDRLYANTRIWINFSSAIIAVLVSFVYPPISFLFLTIPIIYGLVPGALAKTLSSLGINEKTKFLHLM
jgi:uncharacterized membrane protein